MKQLIKNSYVFLAVLFLHLDQMSCFPVSSVSCRMHAKLSSNSSRKKSRGRDIIPYPLCELKAASSLIPSMSLMRTLLYTENNKLVWHSCCCYFHCSFINTTSNTSVQMETRAKTILQLVFNTREAVVIISASMALRRNASVYSIIQ